MPAALARPCHSPGCPALVTTGAWCPAHRRPAQAAARLRDRHRGTAQERGYTADWQHAAKAFLARYPLCPGVLLPTADWTPEAAQEFHRWRENLREQGTLLYAGVIASFSLLPSPFSLLSWDVARPTTVVDHIVPHKGDPELFWAEWNWQPLTKRAHDKKTAREDRGSWTPKI